MAQYERGSTAELVVLWTDFPGGAPVNITSPQIEIKALGGATVVGPTGTGIANPDTGFYTYSYAIPALATVGLYEVIWTGIDAALDPVTSYATFEVVTASEVTDGGDGCEIMEFYSRHWWYANGAIAANVRVAVFAEDQNTLVPIFGDAGLTIPIPNPGVTDANGLFTFYAADGTYWVTAGSVSWAGSQCVTIGTPPGDLFQPLATIDAKGDLYVGIGPDSTTRLGVGVDGQVLTADAAEPTGMKWAPGGGGGGGIPESIIDAKGDLIAGSAPDTAVRLPVGTNGQVLSANSATGTGLQWIPAPGGAVDSVNGQTGVVVLTAADVGAPPTTRAINTANGLTGGGDLSADRTIEPVYGTAANTVAEGDDSRITGAQQRSTLTTLGDIYVATAAGVTTRFGVGGDGQVLISDSGEPTGLNWDTLDATDVGADPAGSALAASRHSIVFTDDRNVLTVGSGDARYYNRENVTLTIIGAWVSAGIQPTDAAILVDVNINGSTIYSTQANRPTVNAGTNGGGLSATPDITSFAVGDYLTVDIDQIGSTIAGGRMTVGIIVQRSS